jgi:hypothetical protein
VQQLLAGINDLREPGRPPVQVIYRVALESTAGKRMTVDEVAERTSDVRDAGMEGVIVETNFCSEIHSPREWLGVLESLKPVLDAKA